MFELQSTLIAAYGNDAGYEKMVALTCGKPEIIESLPPLSTETENFLSKSFCHGVNYEILSSLYPNEYPEVMIELEDIRGELEDMLEDISGYASRSGDCFITGQILTFTVHCDSCDPENYKFKDEGKF